MARKARIELAIPGPKPGALPVGYFLWSGTGELNSPSSPSQGDVLPLHQYGDMAGSLGVEPRTAPLTVGCSTIELQSIMVK